MSVRSREMPRHSDAARGVAVPVVTSVTEAHAGRIGEPLDARNAGRAMSARQHDEIVAMDHLVHHP